MIFSANGGGGGGETSKGKGGRGGGTEEEKERKKSKRRAMRRRKMAGTAAGGILRWTETVSPKDASGGEPLPQRPSSTDETHNVPGHDRGDHISPETLIAVEDILREREETECEETPQKLRVVMWNCGGVGKKEKWIQVKRAVESTRAEVVFLIETKTNKENFHQIKEKLPEQFIWTIEDAHAASKGVAIGIREDCLNSDVTHETIITNECLMVQAKIRQQKWSLVALYRHQKSEIDKTCQKIKDTVRGLTNLVIAGDWNVDPSDKRWGRVETLLRQTKTERVSWELPTHAQGNCIDHLLISEEVLQDNPASIAFTPTLKKDHYLMTATIGHCAANQRSRTIPEAFFENEEVIEEILRLTGDFDKEKESGFSYMRKLKNQAKAVWEKHKEKRKEKTQFRELQNLMAGIRRVREAGVILSSVMRISSHWKKIAEELKGKIKKKKKKKNWRRSVVPQAIAMAKRLANALATSMQVEPPFGDPKEWCGDRLSKKRTRGGTRVKQITTERGIISNRPTVIKKSLEGFWGKTFGQRRDYSPEALRDLLSNHQNHFPELPPHEVNEERVREAIKKTKKTAPGPDSIPFQFYKSVATKVTEALIAMIREAGEEETWPEDFCEARVVLLPKVEGAPMPSQFRPISITNADYRIVTRYWATWLGEVIPGAIAGQQQAVGKDILIDNAIIEVNDTMMEEVARGNDIFLLQTDFAKAYDYINRDAIKTILKHVQTPGQIVNISNKILQEAPITFAFDSSNQQAVGRTGVRQGCPLSPILFCIISDILVEEITKCEGVTKTSAYMDDLGILMKNPHTLRNLQTIFSQYEEAIGAKLNYEKCTILTNVDDFTPEENSKWKKMPTKNFKSKRTVYLGVPIALEFDPEEDWKKALKKFDAVCAKIRKITASTLERIRLINIYAIPVLEYLARFKLIDEERALAIWRGIHKAMAGRSTTALRAFANGKDLTKLEVQIRHPVLQNWALLAARKSKEKGYLNPASIGHARLVARDIVKKKTKITEEEIDELQLHSKSILSALQRTLQPNNIQDKMKETFGGGSYRHFLNNVAKVSKKLKNHAHLLINHCWSLNDQKKHFVEGVSDRCRLCSNKKETYLHLMTECPRTKRIKEIANEITGGDSEEDPLKELGRRNMNPKEARDRILIILCIKMALFETQKVRDFDSWARKKYETLRGEEKSRGKKSRPEVTRRPPENEPKMIFYDGSARKDNLAGGAGAALYEDGEEVEATALTIPYGTNNIGEFTAALIGLKKAVERGWKSVAVVGDCQILTDIMKKGKSATDSRLLSIQLEIHRVTKHLERVEFYHVNREHNKRADAIAFAASLGQPQGNLAAKKTNDESRDDIKDVDMDASINDTGTWEDLEKNWDQSGFFPMPTNYKQPTFPDQDGRVISNWTFYPRGPEKPTPMSNPHIHQAIEKRMNKVAPFHNYDSGKEGFFKVIDPKIINVKISGEENRWAHIRPPPSRKSTPPSSATKRPRLEFGGWPAQPPNYSRAQEKKNQQRKNEVARIAKGRKPTAAEIIQQAQMTRKRNRTSPTVSTTRSIRRRVDPP